jgi:hypothetical protein
MAWLVCNTRVLASAEVADTKATRSKGLLGRDGIDGAIVLRPCRQIHTIGMRFPLDVAFLDADGEVIRIVRMRRHRLGLPVFRARTVIEAEAGAFGRWGLHVGDVIEVRE